MNMTRNNKIESRLKFTLRKYIDSNGRVDYRAIKNDKSFFETLEELQNTNIEELSRTEELAFWLNVYNFFTVKLVLDILEKNPTWKGNLSWFGKFKFFWWRRFKVRARTLNLYNLEHKILRDKFQDPRIHFAINCASASCPFLPGNMFRAGNLDEYLDTLTTDFINNEDHVQYDKKNATVWLNPIFKWYQEDFEVMGGVLKFIDEYRDAETSLANKSELIIRYYEYDWALNKQ